MTMLNRLVYFTNFLLLFKSIQSFYILNAPKFSPCGVTNTHQSPKGGPGGEAKSFDFLSFTHYWAKYRRGTWVIKRKTSKSRLARAISTINIWCKENLHKPIPEQQQALNRKLQGHCSYYGITGNSQCLGEFRYWMVRTWRYWLSRRNRKRVMTWPRFTTLMRRYPIKPARAIHSACLA